MRSDPKGSGQRGFTLIELMVALAILAVIAILSWRALDQVIRGRTAIVASLDSERGYAILFDQIRHDLRAAVTDSEIGQSAITIATNDLQIVRRLALPGQAPSLQVVHYRLTDQTIVRSASSLCSTVGQLQSILSGASNSVNQSEVQLAVGVSNMAVRIWLPGLGWSNQMTDITTASQRLIRSNAITSVASLGPSRSVTGLEVLVQPDAATYPMTRTLLVGQ